MALSIGGAGMAHAQSLPVGGTVASGGATIASNGTVTTVTQSTGRAVVDWTSFDIAANHGVVFVQPNASAATLNRVTGTTGSTIAGSLRSNGAVYLVNPNGIAITATGSVKTAGGFVASTLDISDADFNAGRLNFTGEGASKAVGNAGTISTGSGAYVALLGGSVSNAGTISVPLGKVGLGSGEQATLDLSGDGFMQVAVPSAGTGTAVDMTGQITAAGGRVELKAASVRDAVRNVVNLSGTVSVDNAVGDGGAIVLLGGDGGTVTASGSLNARATGASGNGGSIETSGEHIDFGGLKVDTSAAHGRTGTWLVDPTDLTVDAAAAATIGTNLGTSNVTLVTDGTGASGLGNQSPGNGDITVASAITWSSANTLELDAYNNINLNAAITGTAGGLTLQAGNGTAYTGSIGATAAISVGTFKLNNGNWAQNATSLPGFAATDFQINLYNANFLRVTLGNGSSGTPYQIADVYGLQGMASSTLLASHFTLANAIDASGTSGWNGGAGFVAIGTDGNGNPWNGSSFNYGYFAGFTGTFDGGNHSIIGLTIGRTSDYQGLFGYTKGTISNVVLIGGSVHGRYEVGSLVGLADSGASISGASSSTTVSGDEDIGGLVGGLGYSASISQSSASGTVTSTLSAGGLVGTINAGTISKSFATGNVSGFSAGGLAGLVRGSSVVDQSYASGKVTGIGSGSFAGGLIGDTDEDADENDMVVVPTVSRSYATGAVSGPGTNGGLIGLSRTNISQSYATGAVSGGTYNGGLIGEADQSIIANSAYWDTYSTGQANAIALLSQDSTSAAVAVTSDPTQSGAANYAYKTSAYGNLTASDWIFFDGQTRPFGAWEVPASGSALTNAHQLQLINANGATLAGSYTLGGNIDLSETGHVVTGAPASYAGMWAATGFVALGTDGNGGVNSGIGFIGSFDGENFAISGLTINRTSDIQGLFGYAGGGSINNTVLTGGSVQGGNYVGSLVGIGDGSETFAGDASSVAVQGSSFYAGGLIGYTFGAVTSSSASGTVMGGSYVGGLIGYAAGNVSNSGASGRVTGGGSTGGLIGGAMATVNNSTASGAVSGVNNVGGLVGDTSAAVTGSSATGDVTGSVNVGGLIGQSDESVSSSTASGAVRGSSNIGGLIGYAVSETSTVLGSSATGNVSATNSTAGGLIGYNDSAVSMSFATGTVTGGDAVGGLIGSQMSAQPIDQTYASGAVAGNGYAGGLIGDTNVSVAVTRSFATGSVTGPAAGGLIGDSQAVITQSYATGAVSGSTSGGLVAYQRAGGSLDRSDFWDGYSTGRANAIGYSFGGTNSGAIALTSNPTQSAAANYAYKASAYTGAGGFTAGDWVFFDGQTRPFGSWEVPASGSTIVNSHELQLIGANAASESGSYSLGANIDLAETGANHGTAATSAGMWSSAGFVPIGTDGKGNSWDGTSYKLIANISSGIYGFTGSLDGAGYTLSNLWISRSGVKNVGLFGVASGTLSNLKVAGSVTGGNGAGGLVGMLHGGSVSGSSSAVNVSGATLVGGLVGNQMAGTTITLSSATGTVTGTDDIGGLVGYANGAISLSYATGAASGSHYVGGLVGYAYQDGIANSYATGNATASINSAGGLIGKADTVSVSDSYSIGRVAAPVNAGGMIGQSFGSTIAASYWNTTTSGQSASAGGTGATTSQLQNASTFTGWDFTNNWKISSGYPTLIRNP